MLQLGPSVLSMERQTCGFVPGGEYLLGQLGRDLKGQAKFDLLCWKYQICLKLVFVAPSDSFELGSGRNVRGPSVKKVMHRSYNLGYQKVPRYQDCLLVNILVLYRGCYDFTQK